MSGGSYDYAYLKVGEFADSLSLTTPLRKAFLQHLRKVAKAMHDIEWVDSSDCAQGSENNAICDVLGKDAPTLELKIILNDAKETEKQLNRAIQNAEKLIP